MKRCFDLMAITSTNPFGDAPDFEIIDKCTDKEILETLTRDKLRELSEGGRWVTHFDHIGGFVQYFDGRFVDSAI